MPVTINQNLCLICDGPKAPEDSVCKTCFVNPDAYDLYVMKMQDKIDQVKVEKDIIKCPCCNATVLSLPDHYSRSIRCLNASNLSKPQTDRFALGQGK